MNNIYSEVDRPKHYASQGEIECIDVLEMLAKSGHDFRVLTAMKYLWRYNLKGNRKDIQKAIWYLERYVESEEVE